MGSERRKRHLRFQDGLESRVQVDQCLSECSERPELRSLRGQGQIFRGSLCVHMHPCAFEHATGVLRVRYSVGAEGWLVASFNRRGRRRLHPADVKERIQAVSWTRLALQL